MYIESRQMLVPLDHYFVAEELEKCVPDFPRKGQIDENGELSDSFFLCRPSSGPDSNCQTADCTVESREVGTAEFLWRNHFEEWYGLVQQTMRILG